MDIKYNSDGEVVKIDGFRLIKKRFRVLNTKYSGKCAVQYAGTPARIMHIEGVPLEDNSPNISTINTKRTARKIMDGFNLNDITPEEPDLKVGDMVKYKDLPENTGRIIAFTLGNVFNTWWAYVEGLSNRVPVSKLTKVQQEPDGLVSALNHFAQLHNETMEELEEMEKQEYGKARFVTVDPAVFFNDVMEERYDGYFLYDSYGEEMAPIDGDTELSDLADNEVLRKVVY